MNEIDICPGCGAKLSCRTLEGFCPSCTARLTFGFSAEQSSRAAPVSGLDFGDYELLDEIGRGGMGVVYKARQRSLNRTVAVKLILSGRFASHESVERLQAEAAAAAALRHPNIVAIYELGHVDGQHYFTMDYIQGRSLAQLVRDGPLSGQQAARYLHAIAEAVHYAHGRGTLHRDLKPSNILIDELDQPHITDFGLAKRLDETSALTSTGRAVGSPGYMPPEQARGERENINFRSDVYSLGALLYHLLTGRPPFSAETMQATLAQVLGNSPASPRALNPNVPPDLETVCLKCLEKEASRRYASARELADELARFLANKPIHARPVGVMGKSWRWCRRNPSVAGLAALAFLLFVTGLAGVLWQWRRAESYARRESQRRAQAERALTQLELEYLKGAATNGLAYARLARRVLQLEGYEEPYRFARAELWSRRGLDSSPEIPEVWLAHAEVLLKQGKLQPALDALNSATEKHPGDPDLWLRKGQLLRDHRAWAEAADAFQKAMASAPLKNRSPYRRAATALQRTLFEWKPRAEATALWLPILQIPERDAATPERCLDLSPHFNASLRESWLNRASPPNNLNALPTGLQVFSEIPFDVRGLVQVASKSTETLEPGFPETVPGVDIGKKCRRIHFLHAAGFAYQPKDGQYIGYGRRIASYLVRYADGQEQEIPIVSGENIDEWHVGTWSGDLRKAQLAWEGRIDIGVNARLYHFSWENPRPDVAVRSFDFVSAMAGGAPFLIAVTIEP